MTLALAETLAIGILGVLFVFVLYFILANHNIRTLLQASIPKLRNGRAIVINILKNGDVVHDLVRIEGNKLMKYTKEDGKNFVKNREITPGTKFIYPSSNAPVYFVMSGNAQTFDPTTKESQTEADELTQLKVYEMGQATERYNSQFDEKRDIMGLTIEKAFIVLALVLIFIGGMLYNMNNIMLEISQVLI